VNAAVNGAAISGLLDRRRPLTRGCARSGTVLLALLLLAASAAEAAPSAGRWPAATALTAPPQEESQEEEAQEQACPEGSEEPECQEAAEEAAREQAVEEAASREEEAAAAQEEAPPPLEPIFDPIVAQLPPGTADEIVTIGGSRLIGEVKELKSARLKFKTTATDNIFVKWELVRTVRSSRFFEVAIESGHKFYGLIVGTDDGRLFVGAGEHFTEVARDEVVEISRIRQGFFERFKGNIDLGLSLVKSSNQRDLTANFGARYRTPKWFWRLSGSTYVRRQDNADNVTRTDATVSFNRFFARRWFFTGLIVAEHNNELNLDLRGLAAGGVGYHLVRNIRHDLIVWTGIAPSRERFLDDQPAQSNLEAVLGAYYTFYLLGATDTTAEMSAVWFPSLTTAGRHRLTVDAALRHEITSDLYLSLNGFLRQDTKPPSELTSGSDYGLTLGAGISW
jgi:hypothetical protein